MARKSGGSTVGNAIRTVLVCLVIFVIMIFLFEWLGKTGYIEKAIIKVIREIPFGSWVGKFAGLCVKNFIGAGKDLIYYDTTPMTPAVFARDLLKLIVAGVIFKGLDVGVETLLDIKKKYDVWSIIRKGAIKMVCALIAAWVAALVSSVLVNMEQIRNSSIYQMLTDGERLGVGLAPILMTAGIIALMFLAAHLIYGALTAGVIFWFIIVKLIIINSFSVLFTYFLMLIMLYGIQYDFLINMLLGFLPLILLGIFLLSLFDYGTDRMLGR